MLSHEQIVSAMRKTAQTYPIKKASYFGSYADGKATQDSDLDLLVEFHHQAVSLLMLSALKIDMEQMLGVPVDVIHAPIPKESLIKIGKTVSIYA